MLRRTRLGNLLPEGGAQVWETVRQACAAGLGWEADRWQQELARYQDIVARFYAVPTVGQASVAAPNPRADTLRMA